MTTTVRNIMTRDFELILPETSLQEAAALMEKRNIGMLPVIDTEQVVGTITDRDICIRGVAYGADPIRKQVRDIMTTDITTCHEDDSLEHVVDLMEQQQLRRILVLNDQDKLVGVCALADIATHTESVPYASELLIEVSRPAQPRH